MLGLPVVGCLAAQPGADEHPTEPPGIQRQRAPQILVPNAPQTLPMLELRHPRELQEQHDQHNERNPREQREHRATIVDHRAQKLKKEAEEAERQFRHPSLSFLTAVQEYVVKVGDVLLLQDDVASLFRKHPECRRISPVATSSTTGKVACSKPAVFQAEGSEVIFTYSSVNEILTGATLSFGSALRATTFAKKITDVLAARHPTYKQSFGEVEHVLDSPMTQVSVQQGQKGYLVLIDSHHEERFADSEVYAKAKLQEIDFGPFAIGKTTSADLPKLPKTCEEVSADPEGTIREFYGLCFDFPYEAHVQLEFDKLTETLRSVILSPIGATTGAVVEDALKSRYGLPKFCSRINSSVLMGRIKTFRPRSGKQRMTRMNRRPASVFAGTCETPIVYTSQMRFIFENRNLSDKEILADFERRKRLFHEQESTEKAFDTRKDTVDDFF